jgi:prolyl oligopeptidase
MPLLDMCRFVGDRFGEHCSWAYGDPRRPDAAKWLRRYSPYHNVKAGTAYPATLIVCATCDVRTPPWHGRKMLAALSLANEGDTPILLRVHDAHGHTSMSSAPPWMVAEWLGFLMNELGLTPAED